MQETTVWEPHNSDRVQTDVDSAEEGYWQKSYDFIFLVE
jgi:hypothetical protein